MKAGDILRIAGTNTLIEVDRVEWGDDFTGDFTEGEEPFVRGWELEGPARERTRRCFRAIRLSRLEAL